MFKPNLIQRVKPIKNTNKKIAWAKETFKKRTCNQNIHEYLNNSSLHGLKYIGDSKITLFER